MARDVDASVSRAGMFEFSSTNESKKILSPCMFFMFSSLYFMYTYIYDHEL
jgi:hypothetical protein